MRSYYYPRDTTGFGSIILTTKTRAETRAVVQNCTVQSVPRGFDNFTLKLYF